MLLQRCGVALLLCLASAGLAGCLASDETASLNLFQKYRQTLLQARGNVQAAMAINPIPMGQVQSSHVDLEHHLQILGRTREQMEHMCDELQECPAGGGLGMEDMGSCMGADVMLDQEDMSRLRQNEDLVHRAMNEFMQRCQQDQTACLGEFHAHAAHLHGMFEDMLAACEQMMGWHEHDPAEGDHCELQDDHHMDSGGHHHSG